MMKKRARLFSINTQIRFLTGVAFAAFLLLCFLIYQNTRQLLVQNAGSYSSLINRRLETELYFTTDTANNVLQSLQASPEFAAILHGPYSLKSRLVGDVVNSIVNYSILNPQIFDISLVSDSVHYSKLYSHAELDRMRETLRASDTGFLGVKSTDFYHLSNTMTEPLLTWGALLYMDGQEAGAAIISMRSASIISRFEKEESPGSYFLLCGNEGVLHPFNCTQEAADSLFVSYNKLEPESISGVVDGYSIRATKLPKMDCILLSALDLKSTGSGLRDITVPIWICVILFCAWVTGIFRILSQHLVVPLNQFTRTIQNIRESNSRFTSEPVVLGGCQELAIIGREFTDMIQNIRNLNDQIFTTTSNLYEAKVQKQEAEISWLRSQVDPHFLYNTLELIRKMAIDRDAPEISSITTDIGKIFRYSAKGEALVTLEDEIHIMEAYIHIQQARFGKKIEVFYHFPEETLRLKVIRMLLQPLVENAIFHGLEPKNGLGTLYLGAKREGSCLIINIRDDGIGIQDEAMDAIRKELSSKVYDTSRHVGIINTHARIQLQYGKEYGLQIESTPGDGTNITLRLPAEEQLPAHGVAKTADFRADYIKTAGGNEVEFSDETGTHSG